MNPILPIFRMYIQRCLLYRITEQIREVLVGVDTDTIIIFFYYDREPTEEDEELAGDAGAEVISDFPGYLIHWRLCYIAYPTPIPIGGATIIYARYEE